MAEKIIFLKNFPKFTLSPCFFASYKEILAATTNPTTYAIVALLCPEKKVIIVVNKTITKLLQLFLMDSLHFNTLLQKITIYT